MFIKYRKSKIFQYDNSITILLKYNDIKNNDDLQNIKSLTIKKAYKI